MTRILRLAAIGLGIALGVAALALPATAADTPKRGGTLTFLIPADAPPSLDGHRETTFATIHTAAPFYSVLIRIDPNNPSNSTDFVCDLCTAVPAPVLRPSCSTTATRRCVSRTGRRAKPSRS